MTGKILAKQFALNQYVMQVNLDGVDDAGSLIQPQSHGNCINWILGHIVATRNALFGLLGGEPALAGMEAARYERGSQPIREKNEGLPLERLQAAYAASQVRLIPLLEGLAEDDLARSSDGEEESLAEQLVMLAFHESYHAGQIGLLRRIIGMEAAIR